MVGPCHLLRGQTVALDDRVAIGCRGEPAKINSRRGSRGRRAPSPDCESARLATGGGCSGVLTGERRVSRFRGTAVQLDGLRRSKQGSGLYDGDGTALREGGGDIIGSDGIGKFRNGQDVEASSGEK